VSYGSAMGARAVQQLRETAIELQMAAIRSSVHVPVATLWAHFQGGDLERASLSRKSKRHNDRRSSLVDGGLEDGARKLRERRMKTSTRTHEGRVAFVTGAGQGIGQAIALALAGRGARVVATDLEPPRETARKIGPEAFALQLDVTREEIGDQSLSRLERSAMSISW
jgi:3-oxoacyl-ACP reductase-like protein